MFGQQQYHVSCHPQSCIFDHARELYTKDFGKRFREVASKTLEFASKLAAMMASAEPAQRSTIMRAETVAITVRSILGTRIPQRFGPDTTVQMIKEHIQSYKADPPFRSRLLFADREIEDHRMVMSYGVRDGAFTSWSLASCGWSLRHEGYF